MPSFIVVVLQKLVAGPSCTFVEVQLMAQFLNPEKLPSQLRIVFQSLEQLEQLQRRLLTYQLKQGLKQLVFQMQHWSWLIRGCFPVEEQFNFCFQSVVWLTGARQLLFLFCRFVVLFVVFVVLDQIKVTSFKKLLDFELRPTRFRIDQQLKQR